MTMRKTLFILSLAIAVPVSGQNAADRIMKARALAETGQPQQALEILKEAAGKEKNHSIHIESAEISLVNRDYSAAIAGFTEANRISAASGDFGLAKVYALRGDPATSLYHLDLNLKSQWKKSEKEIMLEPSFGKIENSREWKTFWQKERYTGLEKKVSEIEYYTSIGKTANAQPILNEIKNIYGNSEGVAYSEALVFLSSGKAAECIRVLTALTQANPGNEKYLRLLAKAQEAGSNFAGATNTYSKLIDAGVADARLFMARAAMYRKTGENDKALADVQKYLDYYPDDPGALSLAGRTQAVTGDNLKAIELFSRNIELHPHDAALYVDRGNAYLVAKTWDRAINDYSMSLDLKPGNPDVWLNKGIALLNSGKKTDACHDFRMALSLGNKRAAEFIGRNCIK